MRSPSTNRSICLFHIDQVLPGHSNGMRFTAHDAALEVLAREEYYSIGGGFVVQAGAPMQGRRGCGRRRRTNSTPARGCSSFARQGGLEIHELDAGARAHLVWRTRTSARG